jgi:hypothetical protein
MFVALGRMFAAMVYQNARTESEKFLWSNVVTGLDAFIAIESTVTTIKDARTTIAHGKRLIDQGKVDKTFRRIASDAA